MVRGRAHEVVSQALLTYVRTPTPAHLTQMLPAMDRYLELTEFTAHLVALTDIHVADGATLQISNDTHLVEANKVVMEGTGTIQCSGFTKFAVDSIEQI